MIYKSLSFRVNAAAQLSAPQSIIAMQNFNFVHHVEHRTASTASRASATPRVPASGTRRAAIATTHRKGLTVRGLVGVASGTVYVYKAEIKVTYQVLK